jgi:hypothetical protein
MSIDSYGKSIPVLYGKATLTLDVLKKQVYRDLERVYFSQDGRCALAESDSHQLGVDLVAALVILASDCPVETLNTALSLCGWNEPQVEDAVKAVEMLVSARSFSTRKEAFLKE